MFVVLCCGSLTSVQLLRVLTRLPVVLFTGAAGLIFPRRPIRVSHPGPRQGRVIVTMR